jgi:hypothetical protein
MRAEEEFAYGYRRAAWWLARKNPSMEMLPSE